MTTAVVDQEKVWFTRKQILDAIIFHLNDEGWFRPVPPELTRWLDEQIPLNERIGFRLDQWKASQTGTRRMLWMLITAHVDPFKLCKFLSDPIAIQVMHRRFTDVIDTWGC